MDLAITLMCIGFGASAVIMSAAHGYKVVAEVRMRQRLFDREIEEEEEKDNAATDLQRRLEAFRQERFGRPLIPQRPMGVVPQPNRVIPIKRPRPKDEE